MPPIEQHQSASTVKALYIGESGCLAGDTIISSYRGKSTGKKLSISRLFNQANGTAFGKGAKNWNKSTPTETICDAGGFTSRGKILQVVKSGVKQTFTLIADGKTIRATADHLFKTTNGWLPLKDIIPGLTQVFVWDKSKLLTVQTKEVKTRAWTYSIPYHPFAIRNIVGGRDYKRSSTARLILEAQTNGISLEEFIRILRKEPDTAATLFYLEPGTEVHHLDGDCSNDDSANLTLLAPGLHKQEHQLELNKSSTRTIPVVVDSISAFKEEMTYDIMMEGPHHNFVANSFIVHNSGKTGSIAALPDAGYNVRIIDVDNGTKILKNLLTDPKSKYKSYKTGSLRYVPITDTMKALNGRAFPLKATVWTRALNMLEDWKEPDISLGKITTWTDKDVLVIDSLTKLGTAAYNHILAMNGKLMSGASGYEYQRFVGMAQSLISDFIEMVCDVEVKCNVIIITHINYQDEPGSVREKQEDVIPQQGFPTALGRAIGPRIARNFNTTLMAKKEGNNYKIYTKTYTNVNLKTEAPLSVRDWYPLETGLADYFRDVRGQVATTTPST